MATIRTKLRELPSLLRALSAAGQGLWAHHKGRYSTALAKWERAIGLEDLRTPEYMAFYAQLLSLNKRPAEEILLVFKRIAAGEFHRDDPRSRYAEAYARYWLSYLTGRPDVVGQWLDAHKLRPYHRWLNSTLTLPKNPVDPASRYPSLDFEG